MAAAVGTGMRFVARFVGLASIVGFAWAVQGCSSIQVVQETPRGGVVGLEGPSEGARAKAEEHMRTRCPFGYRIVDEQEARIAYACKEPGSAAPATPHAQVGEVGVSI